MGTNYKAFSAFQVNARWITGWLQGDTISLEGAKGEYMKAASNIRSNVGNLDALETYQQEVLLEFKMEEVSVELAALLKPWRPCVLLNKYLCSLKKTKHRYNLFVMVGRSQTAKTQRLKHAFGDEKYVLEVNCAN